MNDSYLMNLMKEGQKKKESALKEEALVDNDKGFSAMKEDAHPILSDEFKDGDYRIVQGLIGKIVAELEKEREGGGLDLRDNGDFVVGVIQKEINDNPNLPPEEKERLIRVAQMEILGLGPLDPVAKDDEVNEIIVQRWDNVVVERKGILEQTDIKFQSEEHLLTVIQRIVSSNNRSLNQHTPMTDAMLKDGSRVNATIPPASPDGATLAIRKFGKTNFTPQDLLRFGSLDKKMMYFLSVCVLIRKTLMVSGGTSTGKTSLLNTLASFIPEEELVITIEQTLELRLERRNIRRLLERIDNDGSMMKVDATALLRNALRMTPDRIIQGEIRDGAIVSMIGAMSTGHEGSMSTVHANSPRDLLDVRAPILYSMDTNSNFDRESQMMQMASALDVIVQVQFFKAGKLRGKRRVVDISVVTGYNEEKNRVEIEKVFEHDIATDTFRATGYVPEDFIEEARGYGYDFRRDIFRP